MGSSDLVIVSNRGPLAFRAADDGSFTPTRGAGGLVSSLGPAVAGTGATWIASAVSDVDRAAAAAGGGLVEAEGFRLRSLVLDPLEYSQYYDVIANGTLWFVNHGLFDRARQPQLDRAWRVGWEGFRSVNAAFAHAVIDEAPDGATVLVQDYQLSLVGAQVAAKRPDLRTAYFHHTPFCEPSGLRLLPDAVAVELLEGLSGNGAVGFHSRRWADAFEACAIEVLGASPPTFVAPAASDVDDLVGVAGGAACAEGLAQLDEVVGDRQLIVRVDRIELSKNILRGFHAFDDLLRTQPARRGRVVFAALVYPSRQSLPEYQAYRRDVEALAARINDTWGDDAWQPILLDTTDDFPRSVAALRRYDVLLVNPIRDGLNLVAKEGPLLNERDGVVVLSREAGAWDELGALALSVNPFDVVETSDALAAALDMAPDERRRRAAGLAASATSRTPHDWLADQVAAARTPAPPRGPHRNGARGGAASAG